MKNWVVIVISQIVEIQHTFRKKKKKKPHLPEIYITRQTSTNNICPFGVSSEWLYRFGREASNFDLRLQWRQKWKKKLNQKIKTETIILRRKRSNRFGRTIPWTSPSRGRSRRWRKNRVAERRRWIAGQRRRGRGAATRRPCSGASRRRRAGPSSLCRRRPTTMLPRPPLVLILVGLGFRVYDIDQRGREFWLKMVYGKVISPSTFGLFMRLVLKSILFSK